MRILKFTAAVLLIAAAAACGSKSPVSPTSSATAASSPSPVISGATIIGSVRTGSSQLADSTGTYAASGLTVQIAGTSMSTSIGSTGQFTFRGVPAGPVTLTFSGPGVNASLALAPVTSTQTVTITVRVNGSTATLEDETQDDMNNGDSEVNGIISGLSGSASSFQFMVGSRQVKGDSQTQFFGDGNNPDSFANLKDGVRVEVKGTLKSSYVYANRIHVNDGSGPVTPGSGGNGGDNGGQEAEASGAISTLSGSCPSVSFSLGSQAVQTNSSTKFMNISCSSLKDGVKVEVSGTKQGSTIMAAKVSKD